MNNVLENKRQFVLMWKDSGKKYIKYFHFAAYLKSNNNHNCLLLVSGVHRINLKMSEVKPDTTQDSLRRRKKRRRKKRERDPFDLPGVRKIVLSPLVQKIIGYVI